MRDALLIVSDLRIAKDERSEQPILVRSADKTKIVPLSSVIRVNPSFLFRI